MTAKKNHGSSPRGATKNHPTKGGSSGNTQTGARSGKPKRSVWGHIWRWSLAIILGAMSLVAGVFVFAYMTIQVPDPDDFAQAQTTNVYYADGETLMGSFSEYNREIVDYATLPLYVGQAVVSSEDRTFFTNEGVDLKGIARALWNNLRGSATQGGSTITQQYVERYYLGTTTSYTGKFKEAVLAIKVSNQLSKDEILGSYLNTIYFGRGAYGIEIAAQEYFDKSAADLTLSEAALLAGVIPSPSNWDPAVDQEMARARWERVLDLMVDDGYITQEERDAQTFPETIEPTIEETYAGENGYLLTMIRDELINTAGITEAEIDTAGLTIISTIEKDKMDAAIQAVENLPEGRPENNRVGLVSMDPTTGALVAVYGGSDYLTTPQNAVTQDSAQAGSTFKVFALISALEQGASLYDTYESYTPMTIEGYDIPVNNFDSVNRGRINLIRATAHSVNTVYVQLNIEYGPENTMEMAERMGIPASTSGLNANPSNVLGTASPHPIDMVTAYGTIASGGIKYDPYIVSEVRDSGGDLRYQGGTEGERVVDSDVIANATYAMQAVVQEGTGYEARRLNRPVAGKTGTSDEYRSAWFAAFVPQLVTVVDMYQVGPNGEEEVLTPWGGYTEIGGAYYPAQIWTDYMEVALEDVPIEEFPDPVEGEEETSTTVAPTTQSEEPSESPTPTSTPTPEPTTEAPTPEPTSEAPTTTPPATTTPPETVEPTESPTAEPEDDSGG